MLAGLLPSRKLAVQLHVDTSNGGGALARAQRPALEIAEARLLDCFVDAQAGGVAENIEQRVQEGFLALLLQGPSADETVRIGRAAAGR